MIIRSADNQTQKMNKIMQGMHARIKRLKVSIAQNVEMYMTGICRDRDEFGDDERLTADKLKVGRRSLADLRLEDAQQDPTKIKDLVKIVEQAVTADPFEYCAVVVQWMEVLECNVSTYAGHIMTNVDVENARRGVDDMTPELLLERFGYSTRTADLYRKQNRHFDGLLEAAADKAVEAARKEHTILDKIFEGVEQDAMSTMTVWKYRHEEKGVFLEVSNTINLLLSFEKFKAKDKPLKDAISEIAEIVDIARDFGSVVSWRHVVDAWLQCLEDHHTRVAKRVIDEAKDDVRVCPDQEKVNDCVTLLPAMLERIRVVAQKLTQMDILPTLRDGANLQLYSFNEARTGGKPNASQITCHKCGELGHYKADCKKTGGPSAPAGCICPKCGKKGHLGKDCKGTAKGAQPHDGSDIKGKPHPCAGVTKLPGTTAGQSMQCGLVGCQTVLSPAEWAAFAKRQMSYRSKSGKLHALLTPVCGTCQTKYLTAPVAVPTKDGSVYDFRKYTRKHNVYQLGTCKNYAKSDSDGVMMSYVQLDESHQLYSVLEASGQAAATVQTPTVTVAAPATAATTAQLIADQVKAQVEKVALTFQENMVQQLAQQKEQLMKSMATSVAAIPAHADPNAQEMRMQRQMLMSLYQQQQQQQAAPMQQVQYDNYQQPQGQLQQMWMPPQHQIADQTRATPARRGPPALQAANGGRQLGTGL